MNEYLRKQNEKFDAIFNTGHQLGQQQIIDYLQIALHDVGWGEDRIWNLLQQIYELNAHFFDAFDRKNAEADVLQEHLDRALGDICKTRPLIPFKQRYDYIKQEKYGRR